MSAIVRFEDPPGARGRGGGEIRDWAAIGVELKKRPQQWAVVAVCDDPKSAASTADKVRRNRFATLAQVGNFEAVSRTVDGQPRVYARWVGESS